MGIFYGKWVEAMVFAIGPDILDGVVEVFVGVDLGIAEFFSP